MGEIAERWKIEAVLMLVRRTSLEFFRVAGSNDPQSKTRVFMRSIGYRDVDVRAMCVSFHEAEQPLFYPYRKAG